MELNKEEKKDFINWLEKQKGGWEFTEKEIEIIIKLLKKENVVVENKEIKPYTIDDFRSAKGFEKREMKRIWKEWLKHRREEDKREINRQSNKIYRFLNKDKVTKWKKAYYEKNKEKIIKSNNDYRKKNKGKLDKEFRSEYMKEYLEKNKDKKRQYNKTYRKKNKGKLDKQRKDYYEKNKDKIAERQKNYREKNKEKIAKVMKDYYKKNQ